MARNGAGAPDEDDQAGQTPEESLEASYLSPRAKTAQDLLERVQTCSPRFFEKLVVDLLVAMGCGGSRKDAGQAIGRSGDGGVDGIIKEDRLGLDVVHVQATRWRETVGRPTVQAFAGRLEGYRASVIRTRTVTHVVPTPVATATAVPTAVTDGPQHRVSGATY